MPPARPVPVQAPPPAAETVNGSVVREPPVGPDPSRRGRALALVGALAAAMVAIIAVVMLTRSAESSSGAEQGANQNSAGNARDGLPTEVGGSNAAGRGAGTHGGAMPGTGATIDPSTSAFGSTAPAPLEHGSSDPLRRGHVQFAFVAGQADQQFDLDSGTRQGVAADIAAGAVGLTAVNGAWFTPWLLSGPPTAEGCTALPQSQRSTILLLAVLVPGTTICVGTSNGRSAMLSTQPGQALTAGQVYTVSLDYTVWRKTGD